MQTGTGWFSAYQAQPLVPGVVVVLVPPEPPPVPVEAGTDTEPEMYSLNLAVRTGSIGVCGSVDITVFTAASLSSGDGWVCQKPRPDLESIALIL